MKKILATVLIVLASEFIISADASYIAVGSLGENAQASATIGFVYDSSVMHRLTFGFSETSVVGWEGAESDITNSIYNLTTSDNGYDLAWGSGDFYFYWVLRAPQAITAKIQISDLMHDNNGNGDKLNWKLTFNSNINGVTHMDTVLDSEKDLGKSKVIFSKVEDDGVEPIIGAVPVKVVTDKVIMDSDYLYQGTINVIIESA